MTDDKLQLLEKALLQTPFDNEMRMEYAYLLETNNQYEEAAQQYKLCESATPESAKPIIGYARCLSKQDKNEEALECYIRAKRFNDFEADEILENLAANSISSAPISLVSDKVENVIEFQRPQKSNVTFESIVGMDQLKKTLRLKIIEPFHNQKLFSKFKKKAGGGVLLYGPPGCGKTLIARAIATECHASFMSIGISDILNMWIGESERNLASVFEEARANKPCVMFFDELDALAYSRSKSTASHSRTIVNEFLAQLDGFDYDNERILVLAATNMPWDVDPAMKRPGRFSNLIFVPPPDEEALKAIFELKLKEIPVEKLDLPSIAKRCRNYSGADIDGLIDLAKEHVLADILDSGTERPLTNDDILAAFESITPTTIEWLQTARNLVKFSGADNSYNDVKKYLKSVNLY